MDADRSDERARWACCEVVARAALLMDANDGEGLARLFTEDLEFVRPSTFPEVSISGRADLIAQIEARPADMVSRHVCSNLIAEIAGDDAAIVRSYFTHYRGSRPRGSMAPIPMAETLRSVGEYEDHLVLRAEGWLIARRVARFVFGGL